MLAMVSSLGLVQHDAMMHLPSLQGNDNMHCSAAKLVSVNNALYSNSEWRMANGVTPSTSFTFRLRTYVATWPDADAW